MEHFIRIAFCIFTLRFTLSGCIPISGDFKFNILQEEVNCTIENTKLYSPKAVTQECFTSALECIYKELFQTAKHECKDENNRIGQAAEALQRMIDYMKLNPVSTTSKECACENWSEVTFDVFMKNFEHLIQQIEAVRNS